MKKDKIAIVMKEFKKGSLKSSSGQKVTNPKQGIAIALSEARRAKKGGEMKESKSIAKKEIEYMKKGNAPKSLIAHEKKEHAEMGMKRGGASMAKVRTPAGRAVPGTVARVPVSLRSKALMPGPVMPQMQPGMKKGGPAKKYAEGGSVSSSKMGSVLSGGNKPHGEHSIQKSGHTKAKQITMPGNKNMKKGGKV